MDMPNYTKVGFQAKHEMHRKPNNQKIGYVDINLHRSGGERGTTRLPGENDNHGDGQKIRSAGITVQHMTGGTVCPVPKGRMRE